MTGNQLYSSHTYQAFLFSPKEKYTFFQKRLDWYVKIALYYIVRKDLRDKSQERDVGFPTRRAEGGSQIPLQL